MNPVLKTIIPGAHTSVQDFGRTNFRHLGVPTSGALDQTALRLANRLAGNCPDSAGLEILYLGPEFEVMAGSIRIALSGTGGKIELPDAPGRTFPAWQSVRLTRGQKFKITLPPGLVCCYLAIEGGLDLTPVMGSLSTYVRACFGGFNGRVLQKGDEIPLKLDSAAEREEVSFPPMPDMNRDADIRVTRGQQADYFTEQSLQEFTAHDYTILPASDRMGYRLSGFALTHKDSCNIVSDATAVGAIQVPGDGAPIILLADCQTTGGYPKIATVISSDLGILARRPPGSKVSFSWITIEQAEAIARNQEATICALENSALPVSPHSELDVDKLYDANLISGMYNAGNTT